MIAKKGDIIQWSFNDDFPEYLAGKTFQAEVSIVLEDCYGVYTTYGQDKIPFEDATIIKSETI